jgi:nucleoside-diphosphate-sugar epimerase
MSDISLSIAGASGFIGSRFCSMYPYNTKKIDREHRIPATNEIINFVSTTNNYAFRKDITDDVKSNILVMLEILDAAKQKYDGKFVFNQISTWSVYGDVSLPAVETAECNPTGFYSITKRAAEQLLITFCELFGCEYRIFRLCNVIGETDKVTKTKNSIQYLIGQLKRNKDITLYNNGDFLREYMYVDDTCEAIMLAVLEGKKNEIYNIGTGIPSVYGDLIKYCKDQLKSEGEINYIESPIFQGSVQAKDMYLNVDKIKSLGFKPKYDVYSALDIIMREDK